MTAKLLALGVDHHSAPTAVREMLAFGGEKLTEGLKRLRAEHPRAEVVVLSTCNRVEMYFAGNEEPDIPDESGLIGFLENFHAASSERFASHLVSYRDEAMVGHLFRVSASLESLVLGEGQILGQVKDAYQLATQQKTVGPLLHTIFQHALRAGKRVRENTELDQGKLSVAGVAVDVARDVFDTFREKTVLVIGAGKMGELTLQHLRELQPGRILITNRNHQRAADAAERFQGQAISFDRLGQALIEADLIVSTTAAEEPIVSYETFARVQRARRNRLCLILDIAIPRDFDPKIAELEQVWLYNVDDLMSQAQQNLQSRRKSIDSALAIVEKETLSCWKTLLHQRHAGSLLKQLGDYADTTRQRELDRLFAGRPELNESDREAIAHMAYRLQNQFLHHPRSALRAAIGDPEQHQHISLIAAVRRLFGLPTEDAQ